MIQGQRGESEVDKGDREKGDGERRLRETQRRKVAGEKRRYRVRNEILRETVDKGESRQYEK